MKITMTTALRSVIAAGALMGLAACDNDDDVAGGGGGTAPQDQFGAPFATAFNAGPSDEPVDPAPGDLPPLSLTTDPVDF